MSSTDALDGVSLAGKVALVTGGARGIGAATVRLLVECGAQVAVHHHGTPCEPSGKTHPFRQDLAEPGAARALISAVQGHFGRLDYLVNNAAVTPQSRLQPLAQGEAAPSSFQRTSWDEPFDAGIWERAVAINLRVPLELALSAPSLDAIVNVGSGGAQRGDGSSSHLVVTKGAVPSLTRHLARRLAPLTRVNAVLPGLIDTEEIAQRGAAFEPLRQEIIRRTPMGRLGRSEEVAEAIVYLLAGNKFITGVTFGVDGGLHL